MRGNARYPSEVTQALGLSKTSRGFGRNRVWWKAVGRRPCNAVHDTNTSKHQRLHGSYFGVLPTTHPDSDQGVFFFYPTAGSFGVSAQIDSGVSTRVPAGFQQGSARVPRGSARATGWCEHYSCWGYHLSLLFKEIIRRLSCRFRSCSIGTQDPFGDMLPPMGGNPVVWSARSHRDPLAWSLRDPSKRTCPRCQGSLSCLDWLRG